MIIKQLSKLYDVDNCFLYGSDIYERLYNHPDGHKYRIVLSDDDYDYVEDAAFIEQLDELYNELFSKEAL